MKCDPLATTQLLSIIKLDPQVSLIDAFVNFQHQIRWFIPMQYVPSAGDEFQVAMYLSSVKMQSDPRNCTVLILDFITLLDDMEHVFLVMPYLCVFNTPPFHCHMEVVDALCQLLQV